MSLLREPQEEQPLDLEERSPELGLKFKDLLVLGSLMQAGADLTKPRHVVFYSYAGSPETAETMAGEARTRGFAAEVREPLADYPDLWSCVCETHTVVSPDFLRDACVFFEELAERHSAEYDGWEAAAS
jgi:hypothetical protein